MLCRSTGSYESALCLRLICTYAADDNLLPIAYKTPGFVASLINALSPKRLDTSEPGVQNAVRTLALLAWNAESSAMFIRTIRPLSPEEFIR